MPPGLPKVSLLNLPLRWVGVLVAALLILILAAVAYVLAEARDADQLRASGEAGNIAAAISDNIERTLKLCDLALQSAAEQVVKPEVMAAPQAMRDAILFDKATTDSFMGQVDVLDRAGTVVASSAGAVPTPRNDANRDHFRIHVQQPDFGLYLSRPMTLRSEGGPVIALSRRITRPDGSFGGVVVGLLPLESVHQLFRQMKLGLDGSLALFRRDGTLLMREPFDPALVGFRNPPTVLFDLASRASEGEYEAVSAIDGVRRLFRFHRVGALPLIADVGFSADEIYAPSRRRGAILGSLVAACCMLIVLLLVRLAQELRRRRQAEDAFRALADTDALTGLANRRRFDRALRAAWNEASDDGTPLALVMVDVDHFKAFNDTCGHAAGDDLLRRLAQCLADAAWQPGDLAARYGGEEFALVLPGRDRAGALRAAEQLRRQVHELELRHPASPLGRITVSAGCAAAVPEPGIDVGDLCAAADTALYRAKRAGRNGCQACPPAMEPMSLAS